MATEVYFTRFSNTFVWLKVWFQNRRAKWRKHARLQLLQDAWWIRCSRLGTSPMLLGKSTSDVEKLSFKTFIFFIISSLILRELMIMSFWPNWWKIDRVFEVRYVTHFHSTAICFTRRKYCTSGKNVDAWSWNVGSIKRQNTSHHEFRPYFKRWISEIHVAVSFPQYPIISFIVMHELKTNKYSPFLYSFQTDDKRSNSSLIHPQPHSPMWPCTSLPSDHNNQSMQGTYRVELLYH